MYLAITQLQDGDTITTTMQVLKSQNIRAIRLRLFKYASPDGIITLTVKDGSNTYGAKSLTLAEINADIGATYAHGYVLFDFGDNGISVNKKGTESYVELTLEINLASHTDDNSNYIGLCKNFDIDFVDTHGAISNASDMTTAQLSHFQPYGIEVYSV